MEYEYGSRPKRIRTGGMYCAESEKWRNVFTRCDDNESGFGLTGREMEILRLIQRGFLSKEIADKLCISIHTVHIHRQNLLRKLGVQKLFGGNTPRTGVGAVKLMPDFIGSGHPFYYSCNRMLLSPFLNPL